jgi:hypothetical protein
VSDPRRALFILVAERGGMGADAAHAYVGELIKSHR